MELFTTPRVRHHAIISHPSEPRILLLESPAGWELAHFTSDERHTAEVDYINKAVSYQFGIDVTRLRCVRSQRNPVARDHVRIRNAYLTPWTMFEPMDRLERAFDMAQKLSAFQQATSFQYPPSIMRVHWWMESLIAWLLKFLVADRMALP
jgi:hypothetical protein